MAHSRPQARHPHTYRRGTAVANTETPPSWTPEDALNTTFPYTLEEYVLDASRWQAATKVDAARQGPLVALAIGGAARTVVDKIPNDVLVHGGVLDLGDGAGAVHRTGVQLIIHALRRKFPDNLEAQMLRAGLEFFSFQPSPGETVLIIFLRFDTMLEKANDMADLAISYPFRAWMLLSLLRISPKKWADYLKEMGHRFPRTEQQYKLMQENIVRERTLETQVGQLGGGGNNTPGIGFVGFNGEDQFQECLPL